MRGLRFDFMQDCNCVGIGDGMLKLLKTSGTYKDFGKSLYEVWVDAFHNYTTIFVFLFGKEAPDLHATLAKFYSCIYKFSIVKKSQKAVLSMAIEAHTFIVAQQPTDPLKSVIPEKFQGRFYILEFRDHAIAEIQGLCHG